MSEKGFIQLCMYEGKLENLSDDRNKGVMWNKV